jgi:hypothetical protein
MAGMQVPSGLGYDDRLLGEDEYGIRKQGA